MQIDFIHIGMMKTGTTYMQNIWLRDKGYALSHRGNIQYLQEIRKHAAGKGKIDNSVKLNLDKKMESNQNLVVSNEGFSTAYINDVESQTQIPIFIDMMSKMLSTLPSRKNVFIVVREPISWIKSVYNQSIKQGSYGNAQLFIESQELFVKYSLDMEHIIESYEKYFDKVLVLPFELFKNDEKTFWNKISDEFNVKKIHTRIDEKINTSLSSERIFLLSKLNGMSKLLIETINNTPTYKNIQEKNNLISSYENSGKWLYRRILEHGSDSHIEELKKEYNIGKMPDDFFDFELSSEMVNSIEEKYISFLENYLDPEYINMYKEKFNDYKW